MNVVLYSPRATEMRLREEAWIQVLDLARGAGWRPAGTLPPPVSFDAENGRVTRHHDWDGRYTPAAGQTVTAEDARHIASAILSTPRVPADVFLAEFVDFAVGGFIITAAADLRSGSAASSEVDVTSDSRLENSVLSGDR
jgi:hypothetical protein